MFCLLKDKAPGFTFYMHAYMYVCMHVCHAWKGTCKPVCMLTYIYICVCVCVCQSMHIYIYDGRYVAYYMNVCMHIHTDAYVTQGWSLNNKVFRLCSGHLASNDRVNYQLNFPYLY